MKTLKHTMWLVTVLAVVTGLTACGGGGGNTSLTGDPKATASTVQGVITNFGSVWVNGVEYATQGAQIMIDGQPGSEDDLAVGMFVTLTGQANGAAGTALDIAFNDDMEGVIEQVDSVAGSIRVMGQTVRVDANTVFDSEDAATPVAGLLDLATNQVIEVSGYSDGMGDVLATRITLKAADLGQYMAREGRNEIELKGVVYNLDTNAQTFQVGELTIDYSGMAPPVEGQYVEVKSQSAPLNGVLTASRVEPEGDGRKGVDMTGLPAGSGDIEIEGMITNADAQGFMLNGQRVLTSAPTRFDNGSGITDVTDQMLARAEGYLDVDGNLVAEKVELKFRDGGTAESGKSDEHAGRIAGIKQTGSAYEGTVTLEDGSQFQVDGYTIMKDDSGLGERYFSLARLAVGDSLEVKLMADGQGGWKASKLEREMAVERIGEGAGMNGDGADSPAGSDGPDMQVDEAS